MSMIIINPAELFDPVPYGFSHVAIARAQSIIFIAGQGGEDRHGRLAEGFEGQLRQAFANLTTALAAAGAEPHHVARITTYIVDHEEAKLGPLAQAVTDLFGPLPPPQTLVPVPRLALDGMLFEVEAIAALA